MLCPPQDQEAAYRRIAAQKTNEELVRYLENGAGYLRKARKSGDPKHVAMWELHQRILREEQESRS